MLFADNFCKHLDPDQARNSLKLNCSALIVLLEEFFEKLILKKNQQITKRRERFPSGHRVKLPDQLV